MDIDVIFNEPEAALAHSSNLNDTTAIESAIQALGMQKCDAEDPKFVDFNNAFELRHDDQRVLIQYRFYDTSKAFSISPDMNVYLIKHLENGAIVREKEIKFLDTR